METLWFVIVAFMLAMYVILDGFDLGAGILHLLIGRNEQDRRTILNAIGPVWDGNEVWLLAAGGTLYFAFPLLYASSFSGFYLPLIIVLWLLMLRGLGIEFRHHVHHSMWKSFWDAVFAAGSILLAIFFGAALGNVIRGVPLNADGYFFEPLWTTFTVVPEAGILDWFTVLMGIVAFCTLTMHGGNYLAMKTEHELQDRARRYALYGWIGTVATSLLALFAVSSIRPSVWDNVARYPLGWILPVAALGSAVGTVVCMRRKQDSLAFLSSSVFIASMLGSTAFGLYPVVLPASTNPDLSLTIFNTAAPAYGLGVGIVWWILGMVLAAGYFIYVYRSFRGKVKLAEDGSGY